MRYLSLLLCATLMACSCSASIKAGNRTTYVNDTVKEQYENAASVEVTCVFAAPEEGTPKRQVYDFLKSMGAMPNENAPAGWGSAVAIGPTRALTARHVISCDMDLPFGVGTLYGNPWKIVLQNRWGVKAEFVVDSEGDSPADDVAVLLATGGREIFPHWAELGDADPPIGDSQKPETWVCLMAAYPWVKRACGPVSEYETEKGKWMGEGYVIYDLHSESGNSGGGVYYQGKLVAIHVAHVGGQGAGGYVISRWRHRVPPIPLLDLGQ